MSEWMPMEAALFDDSFAWVKWEDGSVTREDLDHDGDPHWWKQRGAIGWMPLKEETE